MRPYKIPKSNTWVDLDTIQCITEPIFVDKMGQGGYFIVMRCQHAFRNEETEYWFDQGWEYDKNRRPSPKKDENGKPSEIAVIRKEIFEPLFKAWTGNKS